MALHAPSPRRERVIVFGDRGGGKSSAYISIADYLDKTGSDRVVWLLDTDHSWDANRAEDGGLDKFVRVFNVDREEYGGPNGWAAQVRGIKGEVCADDWFVVDLQSHAWEGAQRWYWGQKSGNDSLAELWLKHSAQDISGDHGTNWGIINKFYGEFTSAVLNLPCHVMLLAHTKDIRSTEDTSTKNFYGKVPVQMAGQGDLRGEGHTVIYAFEANGSYRYTTVKEKGPLGRPKRELLLNQDVTDTGFVPGYLFKVAKWRP